MTVQQISANRLMSVEIHEKPCIYLKPVSWDLQHIPLDLTCQMPITRLWRSYTISHYACKVRKRPFQTKSRGFPTDSTYLDMNISSCKLEASVRCFIQISNNPTASVTLNWFGTSILVTSFRYSFNAALLFTYSSSTTGWFAWSVISSISLSSKLIGNEGSDDVTAPRTAP